MNQPLKSWSHTWLKTYENCPRKYQALKVTKEVKEDDSKFSSEGKDIHRALEHAIGHGADIPSKFSYLEKYVKPFRSKRNVLVEQRYALREDFSPCEFFAKDAWVRSVADLVLLKSSTALLLDWKTGKIRPERAQLVIMAFMLFQHYPALKDITAGFVWVKHDEITRFTLTREEVAEEWSEIIHRVKELERACLEDVWPMTPNGLCGYCPVMTCPHR